MARVAGPSIILVELTPEELDGIIAEAVGRAVAEALADRRQEPAQSQGFLAAVGYVQLTALTAAVGLGTIPPGATVALVQCETAAVRWRDDGTAPTATVGTLLQPGDLMTFDQRLDRLSFIQTAAGAKLNVSFYASQ